MTSTIRPDEIDRDFVPVPRASVGAVEVDDEAVVFDEESGTLHLLDPIGTVVWGCFDGTVTIGQLAEELAEAYQAPTDTIEQDVLQLTRSLGSLGLLAGVEGDEADQAEESDVSGSGAVDVAAGIDEDSSP